MELSSETIYQNLIDGHWVPGEGPTYENRNPTHPSKNLGIIQEASEEQVQHALSAAKKAFSSWRKTSPPERARFIARAMEVLREKKEILARAMSQEEGKLLRESRGEIEKSLLLMEYYAGAGTRLGGETFPSELPKTFTYTVRQPLGVVGLITPWNFPMAILVWKLSPALVAGNTVVCKPSPITPACSVIIAEAFQEAGLPEGVLNVLQGDARVGKQLSQAKEIRAISFTGSTSVGLAVYQNASERGVRVTCEMGGKNAVVVLEDANLSLATTGILQGAFGSTGQRCTATSRVIVHKDVREKLCQKIVEGAKAIQVGDPFDEASMMGPIVSEEQLNKTLSYIEIAKEEGATLLCGGNRLESKSGYFIEPTVFIDVRPGMRIAKEEVFGPVLSIIEAESFEEALQITNNVEYGLTSSIYTQNPNLIMEFVENAEVGMVHINQATVGGEAQLPFGGIKNSGIGDREMGRPGIEFFTEQKTVFYDYTGTQRKSNIY